MSVIAEFTISSDEFILGQVLARDPGTNVEMERVVPASGRVMPYVWVHDTDFDVFETAIRESDYVDRLVALDVLGNSALYRVEWDEDIESLIYGMAETNATILEARGNNEWFFRIRFDTHSGMTQFHNYCMEQNIKFQLHRVYTLTESKQADKYVFDLTDTQRAALLTAVENGYFDVPRGTTLSEIGETLGISEQAASENVRRGAGAVLGPILLEQTAADLRI